MRLIYLIPLLLLVGCGPLKITFVDVWQETYYDDVVASKGHIPTVYQSMSINGVDWTSDTDQTKKDITNIPVAWGAGQSNVDSETENAVADQDNSLNDSLNESNSDVSNPTPVVENNPYLTVETVELRTYEDKSFNWLPNTGAYYGKNVHFVFDNNCGELVVPDAAVSHSDNGIVYFCGTDFEPGTSENNGGRASIFTAPGCVAERVTVDFGE